MKFFERFKKTKNTADLTEWYNLADFLGIDKNMDNDERAEATYFACLKILSEAIGKLPLKLLRKTKKDGVIEATAHPLYNVVRNRPNKYMTSTTFWGTNEYYRNHDGNAVSLIVGFGEKLQLIPLDFSKVQIWYDDGKLLSDNPDVWYLYSIGGTTYKFSSEEVLHFRSSISEDGIEGLSVREILRSTIKGNQKAQKMQNALYDSGFTAKAVVQYTGNLKDESVIRKVEEPNPAYRLVEKGAVLNWWDITEVDGFCSLNSRLRDVIEGAGPEGTANLMAKAVGAPLPVAMLNMMNNMTVLRIIGG